MTTDWSPETYGRFRGFRLRPALDLLAQVGDVPDGPVVDLGCGDGAVAGPLRARFPARRLVGVDGSPAMLARAVGYDATELADIAAWRGEGVALIFSNAALHWLGDHAGLMPRLAGMLGAGGVLAVQMPRQYHAPSHALLRELAEGLWPQRFDFSGWTAPVMPPEAYARMLGGSGEVSVWETVYLHRLAAADGAHPVRLFTESTAMRPFVEGLTDAEKAAFLAEYEAALWLAYPAEADGSVIFPFTRLFFTLRV